MNGFENALNQAEKGKKLIDAYTRKDAINQIFLIFSDDDPMLLDSAFRYIDRIMQEADFSTIFTSIDLNGIEDHITHPYEIISLSSNDMKCLIRFASMAQIDVPSIKIMSLRMPKSQRGELLPGYKDISMDVAVVRGLYGIFGEYA